MKKLILLMSCTMLLGMTFPQLKAQVITWGPSTPATTSDNIHTCYNIGNSSVEFTNAADALVDATIEVQLDTGIYYVNGSLSFTSTGSATIVEDDLSNLNRPSFYIGGLASLEEISLSFDRTANCEAMAQKISGSSFVDTTRVYEAGIEVSYSNSIVNGTVNYDVIYGSLSITNVSTDPDINNFGGTSSRQLNITNGSFGVIEDFYFTDIFDAGELTLSDFIINPDGINYLIPSGNINIVGDSVIISFTSDEIVAINGSGGTMGDGDNLFEKDEFFVLEYSISSNSCGTSNTIPSKLLAWFGCNYGNRCQYAENAASLGLTNATPSIVLSDALIPALDFCDTVIYSVTLTNNSEETNPAGGAFAKDVTALLGFRANTSPIATLSNVTQWGSGRYNTKFFINHKLNGYDVTLPTIAGLYSTMVPYLPPDYFNADPDGPGGLTDLDGDGFYDDLPKDSVLTISYGVYIVPREKSCSTGRSDYIYWEHISADISWFNQCGTLMSPQRQEFNYTNQIRDYLNSTYFDHPTDVSDDDTLTVSIKPHLGNNGIYCNGEDGLTGTSVEWVTQLVLPSGMQMKTGYDPTTYTVSNDTVITSDSYAYDWTDFPLEFECDDWDGSNPLSLNFTTIYICSDGVDTCYQEEVHCYDISMVPHCPGACKGVSPLGFDVSRISESWTDNSKASLVDLDDPSIVKDMVYPYDTIELITTGVFNDTMSDQLYLRVTYTPEDGGNIFSYQNGSIEIADIDGQYNSGTTNYSTSLSGSPIVNHLGGNDYEMIFDLSSYRTIIDPSYQYGQNSGGPPTYDADSVKVTFNVVISNSMATASYYNVDNFRSEFFIYDDSSNEVICNSWGSSLAYHHTGIYAGDIQNAHSGCGLETQRFYLTHQSYTEDDHPNEYRPPFEIDSAVVVIPSGWDLENVYWIDNSLMDATDYELQSDGTLIIRRPSDYKDYDKQNTFYPKFSIDLRPNCQAPNGKSYFDYTAYFKEYTYLTDATSHLTNTSSDNGGYIEYTAPTTTLTPLIQAVTAYEDTVQWAIRVCNSTSDMDIDYNWLLLNNESNEIQIDSLVDITGGANTLLSISTTPDNAIYAQIGTLNQGTCANIKIYSSFTACDRDTLNILHGWSCSAYPTVGEAEGCTAQNELYILPESAQISATVTPLTNTPTDPFNPAAGTWGSSSVNMCDTFPSEVMVINAQPAYLYDVILKIKIPSSGSGLTYVPNSATIEIEGIDAVDTPRAIGASAEGALITASNNGDQYWMITLQDIDPTNFGSGEPFSGTLNSSKNEFILRWEMESTCNLISGDDFEIIIEGDDPCGDPALGSGEKINGFPINLNGVSAPYFSFITIDVSPDYNFEGCSDNKTINLELLLSGGTTGTTDTLDITLPTGIGYNGSYTCSTPGKCPTYVSSEIVSGQEIITFKYPSGVSGNIDFSFDINTSDRGACSSTEVILFQSKTTLTGLACGGFVCAATEAFTGNEEVSINIDKPELDIVFNSLIANTASAPAVFDYEVELSNTGLDTKNDVIIEFYCLDGTGNDISGSAVAKDTLKSILSNGSTAILSGSFGASCNPADGLAVLIVPEYENCYCNALKDMDDKSSGLNEIPHDKIESVTLPIELINFSVKANDCDISIEWKTLSEKDNHYIDLEKSYNGNDYTIINRFPGEGDRDTPKQYQGLHCNYLS